MRCPPQVVVVAEDGVTSRSYPVAVTRLPNPVTAAPSNHSAAAGSGLVAYDSPVSLAEQRRKGAARWGPLFLRGRMHVLFFLLGMPW